MADMLRKGCNYYGLSALSQRKIVEDYESTGFGYAGYPGNPDYGVTLLSPNRMEGLVAPGWIRLHAWEKGWDDHQDVHAFKKSR